MTGHEQDPTDTAYAWELADLAYAICRHPDYAQWARVMLDAGAAIGRPDLLDGFGPERGDDAEMMGK
jgi:hypothetical protein